MNKSNITITKLDPTSRSNFDTVEDLWASFRCFQTNTFPIIKRIIWSDLNAALAEAMAQSNGGAIMANIAALERGKTALSSNCQCNISECIHHDFGACLQGKGQLRALRSFARC